MKSIINKIINFLIGALCFIAGSCADDFPYQIGDIPEGEGQLTATVTFTPTAMVELSATRTAGDALNDINSLCVLVYSQNGKELLKSYTFTGAEIKTHDYNVKEDNKDLLDDDPNTDEETTKQTATFTLANLPYGIYKIYAVANMGDLQTSHADEIQNEDDLKKINLTWLDNVESNNQMFGYFTSTENVQSKGFDAQPITFDKPNTQIHAWLKRAASKVTVAFDPSGLKQGVSIYIKNVTIRDIPKTCYLGADNTPTSFEELWNHLDTPFGKPELNEQSEYKPYTRFEYDRNGIITETNKHTGTAKTDGYVLENATRHYIPTDAHATNAPSLFFYENNQQPYYDEKTKGLTNEQKKKYDKQQQPSKKEDGSDNPDGVGDPIRDPDDDKDYKDRIPYGTYIEVEAYYISTNPDRPGEGPIKYRFMLGKNVTDNYNAQRNYHFKLTLGFNRWANNPDWHIDYEQPAPGLEVQPTFRVSYLYHQMSELPIRILGKCQYLTVKIVENNWAPYDSTSTNQWNVPPTIVPSSPETYQFQWNLEAFLNPLYMEGNKPKPQFGFLALHLPDRNTTSVQNLDYNDTDRAVTALTQYYNDNLEGERRFDSSDLTIGDNKVNSFGDRNSSYKATADDVYRVIPVLDDMNKPIDGEVTLMLPVWTRALSLIENSGLSGNNPYEAFERKAKLEISALFEGGMRITEYVDVLQVKRIVNPKGVWRAHDRPEPFYVTLYEAKNSNQMSDFQSFTSQGEWKAFIEKQSNDAGFTLSKSPDTDGYTTITENGTEIHGYTGSKICFAINFGEAASESSSPCAIVKVLYHGNQCMHKILVRKGYNNPIELGGHKWSSFSLYQATRTGGTEGNETFNAVLTKNPLMLGSMFRRGRQEKGIFVSNNMKDELGPFMPPGDRKFVIGHKTNGSWDEENWTQIGYRDDAQKNQNTDLYGWTAGSRSYGLGTFESEGTKYRVPTYQDFQDLADACENGFGVFYGSAATEPATTAEEAYGLIDPNNEGLFNSKMGMRGVVAYDRTTGDQIFFPMGKYGTGRRNNFVMTGINAGVLRYGDVDYPLSISRSANNLYRPVPYNLRVQPGNIYWIDKYVDADTEYTSKTGLTHTLKNACLGWDMNYFNFDFNAFPANNWRDACPIKFIVVE